MKQPLSGQSLVGLLIIALGVGFLLDALNLWNFSVILADWWPLLIVAMGLLTLLSNPKEILWPFVMIGAGMLLLLRQLDAVSFNVWSLIWPILLIVVGFSFITDRLSPKPKQSGDDGIDLFVAFSGLDISNKSSNFTGGKATVLFGGMTLDLRHAKVKKEAYINSFTGFGGLELKVPDTWIVKTSGMPLFGGWEDKTTKPTAKNAPVLHVRGTCLFGGVEIKN